MRTASPRATEIRDAERLVRAEERKIAGLEARIEECMARVEECEGVLGREEGRIEGLERENRGDRESVLYLREMLPGGRPEEEGRPM